MSAAATPVCPAPAPAPCVATASGAAGMGSTWGGGARRDSWLVLIDVNSADTLGALPEWRSGRFSDVEFRLSITLDARRPCLHAHQPAVHHAAFLASRPEATLLPAPIAVLPYRQIRTLVPAGDFVQRLGRTAGPKSDGHRMHASSPHTADITKTRGQAKPKRQPKQPVRYDPAKQGKQTPTRWIPTGKSRMSPLVRQLLKATNQQARKVKAAWKACLGRQVVC
jgi:hypothetical protein